MVLGRVPSDPMEGNGVVEDEMSEETPVLVAALRVTRKVEPIPLQVLPEQFGRQRMVLGPVLSATIDTIEGSSDRIAGFLVAELHDLPRDIGAYLDKLQCRGFSRVQFGLHAGGAPRATGERSSLPSHP